MINESIKAVGNLVIQVTRDGTLVEERTLNNLVVTVGKEFVARRMINAVDAVMSHMAIGTGATAAVIGNTTLGTEAGRVALTAATNSAAIDTFTASFPAGTGTGTITEAGIFNAGAAGTMLSRVVFAAITKGAGDVVAITWNISIT